MKPKYKLYDTKTGELIPLELGQCYADDNTATFGGYLGQLQAEGRLEFRLNDDPEPIIQPGIDTEKLAMAQAIADLYEKLALLGGV